MTNDEALKILPDMKGAGDDWDKAIDLAVEALKVQLSKEDATSDCISRQAVIDTLRDWICGVGERCVKTHCQCIRRIEAIPSVDVPDTNVGDMISRQGAMGGGSGK